MKRILALLLAAIMLVPAMIACNKTTNAPDVGTTAPAVTTAPVSEPEVIPPPDEYPAETPKAEAPVEENTDSEMPIDWAEVLSELTKTNMPLWGVLSGSSAIIRGDYVLIKSDNPTLSAFIKTGGNAKDVKEAIIRVTGKRYRLGLQGASSAPSAGASAPAAPKDPLENLISRAKDMGINIDVNN